MLATDYKTPGQLIQGLLDERGWNQNVLAIVLKIDKTVVNRMIADKRPVDAKTALAMGGIFNVPPEWFLELQKNFDLAKARLTTRDDPGRATRACLFGDLPVAEMIKRGWLETEDVRDLGRVEIALMKFFGVDSLDEIEVLPHAAKKTAVNVSATPAQVAWLYRVKQIAADMLVAKYSPSAVKFALKRMDSLLAAPEEARKVPRILAESGIRFVIVESLTSAKIDGVCFWLNQAPVIGLSLRHNRIDNFWFVLRHELEHVLRLHGQAVSVAMLDPELEGECAGNGPTVPEEERIANEAAANFCVPKDAIDKFIARKAPFFAERDILGFAKTLNIHPGLVAGQLQRRTGRYDRFRSHLVKIRSIVAPGAMVDGWGDVAPVGL
jgi:HTH-type transcriptional regulator / antitoxin HigA